MNNLNEKFDQLKTEVLDILSNLQKRIENLENSVHPIPTPEPTPTPEPEPTPIPTPEPEPTPVPQPSMVWRITNNKTGETVDNPYLLPRDLDQISHIVVKDAKSHVLKAWCWSGPDRKDIALTEFEINDDKQTVDISSVLKQATKIGLYRVIVGLYKNNEEVLDYRLRNYFEVKEAVVEPEPNDPNNNTGSGTEIVIIDEPLVLRAGNVYDGLVNGKLSSPPSVSYTFKGSIDGIVVKNFDLTRIPSLKFRAASGKIRFENVILGGTADNLQIGDGITFEPAADLKQKIHATLINVVFKYIDKEMHSEPRASAIYGNNLADIYMENVIGYQICRKNPEWFSHFVYTYGPNTTIKNCVAWGIAGQGLSLRGKESVNINGFAAIDCSLGIMVAGTYHPVNNVKINRVVVQQDHEIKRNPAWQVWDNVPNGRGIEVAATASISNVAISHSHTDRSSPNNLGPAIVTEVGSSRNRFGRLTIGNNVYVDKLWVPHSNRREQNPENIKTLDQSSFKKAKEADLLDYINGKKSLNNLKDFIDNLLIK